MKNERSGRFNGFVRKTDPLWQTDASVATYAPAQEQIRKSGTPRSVLAKTLPAVLVALGLSLSVSAALWSEPMDRDVGLPIDAELIETEENLTVAFLGDHGTGRDARRVLELIKSEGVDMVLSQGDLGYDSSPEAFERMLHETLGPDFPFFASLGNHDRRDWRRYRDLLKARAERIPELTCEGEIGIKAACSYKGLFFITSAVKVFFFDADILHADFMFDQLTRTASRWRICSWHFNQAAMQVGAKEDQAGWRVYEACRKGGAVIMTAHEHSYARTHLIGKFAGQPEVASYDPNELNIVPGQSIAVVSGLAGRSARPQIRYDDWWAAAYTASHKARPGALICRFHVKGRKDRADCAFKAINGDEPDHFTLWAQREGDSSRDGTSSPLTLGDVDLAK